MNEARGAPGASEEEDEEDALDFEPPADAPCVDDLLGGVLGFGGGGRGAAASAAEDAAAFGGSSDFPSTPASSSSAPAPGVAASSRALATWDPVRGQLSRTSVAYPPEELPRPVFLGGDRDLPRHGQPLPPEVKLECVMQGATFDLRCKVDLQQLAGQLRNATLSLRNRCGGPTLMLRMISPVPISAQIRETGQVQVKNSKASAEEVRAFARRVARLVQKCGYPDVKLGAYRSSNFQASVSLGFPVRLELLAKKWHRHSRYEPEVSNDLSFMLTEPRATVQLRSTGRARILGVSGPADALEAVRIIYPLAREFSR